MGKILQIWIIEDLRMRRRFARVSTAAMLVSQTNPLGVELFSYPNAFFCYNKFAYTLATWVKTLYMNVWEGGDVLACSTVK